MKKLMIPALVIIALVNSAQLCAMAVKVQNAIKGGKYTKSFDDLAAAPDDKVRQALITKRGLPFTLADYKAWVKAQEAEVSEPVITTQVEAKKAKTSAALPPKKALPVAPKPVEKEVALVIPEEKVKNALELAKAAIETKNSSSIKTAQQQLRTVRAELLVLQGRLAEVSEQERKQFADRLTDLLNEISKVQSNLFKLGTKPPTPKASVKTEPTSVPVKPQEAPKFTKPEQYYLEYETLNY